MKKRHLYQSKHPFDPYPFEVFHMDSWRAVEYLRVEDGTMTMHLGEEGYVVDDKRPFQRLRLRSRRATITDCTCFLRPGVDVCVHSFLQTGEVSDTRTSEQISVASWVDAKIISVERRPHESECSCQFYVSLYIDQGCIGQERIRISKDTKAVGINQISVHQKLYKQPITDQYYRWSFSEDCTSLIKTRLTLAKFLQDYSWLLVASVMKRIEFHIRSVQKKVIYQIMADEDPECSNGSGSSDINAVQLSVEDDILVSKLVRFSPTDPVEEIMEYESTHETELVPYNELVDLRRSKRRHVKPDRFSGCDQDLDSRDGWVRMRPYRCKSWNVDDEDGDYDDYDEDDDDDDDDSDEDDDDDSQDDDIKEDSDDDLHIPLAQLFRKKGKNAPEGEHGTVKGLIEGKRETKLLKRKERKKRKMRRKCEKRERRFQLAIIPFNPDFEAMPLEQFGLNYGSSSTGFSKKDYVEEIDKYCKKSSGRPSQRPKPHSRSIVRKRGNPDEPKTYKRVSLSAGAYNKLIDSYMQNLDFKNAKDETTSVVDKWEELKKATRMPERVGEIQISSSEDDEDEEDEESEMLWREMEICMASAYFLEDTEARVANEAFQKSKQVCEHDYRLDEEIGLCCRLCGHVGSEIKDVTAPFAEQKTWTTEKKVVEEEDIKRKIGRRLNEDSDVIEFGSSSGEMPPAEESDNVWTLIPKLEKKLHSHQKRAFEFLWRNLSGSIEPPLMNPDSGNIGGCVISHSPGAGKTFLIIAFLTSYLKLFPGKRPLVLAPKTTLYTWYKEFIKWDIPIPVHLIHGRRSYRTFNQNTFQLRGVPRPSQDVMHVCDCLEKIQKWHTQPSVLVMGYTSFQTLMREESKFAHRRYMAKVLRESPGVLILDEGHNPRSTKSRLRKALMKVDTNLRILLSGTLFQNNFCEYFNTLCLARPKFVDEVLMELDPKYKNNQGVKKAPHLVENRARKFFLDVIAKKIDSNNGDERMQGLNMLRNLTTGFIDVYEGSGSADALPGLQIYTLLMNSTDVQHNTLVKLQDIMSTYHGYPLELELLITLAAIHPWLVKSSTCVNKFFEPNEVMEFEKLRYDARKGSKVMFVLNLVYRVVKKEKILIFCHNIAPIRLFLELFENVFRWQRGRELLTLTGDLELFERGKVIDKFEDRSGPSRVLLASITACAEGISLTAASRVIMLDSEWNPSKTKQAIARAFRPGQQKVVYVYQLLARGTLEEDKYRRTTWKEWVSSMIFSEEFVEDPSQWQAEKIEDDVLREIVEEDKVKSFHMIMKNEKASTG